VIPLTQEQPIGKTNAEAKSPSLQTLIKAFQEMNRHDDFSVLTNTILKLTTQLYGAEAATLLLVNKMTGDLEIAAVKYVPEEIVTQYMQRPTRAAIIADFYTPECNPFRLRIEHEPVSKLAAAGYAHFSILPIRIQEKIIGYLTLASEHTLFEQEDAQEKIKLFLEYIAQAIENAYFIFQLQQQNARLELMMTKLQNTQNHLKRAEKMALVGKIAATVAHEIRNPLTVIGTSLQLIFEKMEKDHPDRELYEHMINRVRSVDQTIKELMVFARPLKITAKPLDLEKTLNRVISFVQKKYESRGLQIKKQFPDNLPLVYLDEEQTQRIFINLLLNAYNFLPENGTVMVRAWHNSGDPWVTMEFVDNGTGIAPEHINQIFEPFFTTRVEGNGLGLFLVKHLLEEMDGAIEVQNETRSGAQFRLRLPMVK